MNRIILAGGCFWGIEEYFSRLLGVLTTKCIYIDGNILNPKYEDLKNGIATHAEAVYIEYDNRELSLKKLLYYFIKIVNPFSINKQGEDEGIQYRSGIYYLDNSEYVIITDYLKEYFKDEYNNVKIVVKEAKLYYLAEEYHQNYLKKNKDGYCHVNFDTIEKGDLKK